MKTSNLNNCKYDQSRLKNVASLFVQLYSLEGQMGGFLYRDGVINQAQYSTWGMGILEAEFPSEFRQLMLAHENHQKGALLKISSSPETERLLSIEVSNHPLVLKVDIQKVSLLREYIDKRINSPVVGDYWCLKERERRKLSLA